MKISWVARLLVGNPLATDRLRHERLSKTQGLAVFSSDAMSSSAYATEEMMRALIFAGGAGLAATLPISLAIFTLLIIVGISYFQTIHAYPSGGGAYIVAHENLGVMPGLIAGAALLFDYILTVAVSISAGVAAITSAFPMLYEHRLAISLFCIVFISVANLRGVRESGTLFSIPAYGFIVLFGGMIIYGIYRAMSGSLPHGSPDLTASLAAVTAGEGHGHGITHFQTLSLFLILHGFASGAAALTGVEAVSNGVPAFRQPESRNASTVLILMIAVLGTFFLGVTFLAGHIGVNLSETETVISQVARGVFGNGTVLYYAVQGVTMLILILAANTAYADFPRLSYILAKDQYLPRQFANLGDRLVFANGIIVLGVVVSILLIYFQADTHSLVPLYMVGVFVSFTLSQTGMVIHWLKVKGPNWKLKLGINAFGAVCTFMVGIVVAAVKFLDGAWMTIIIIAAIVMIMLAIYRHYEYLKVQLSLNKARVPVPFSGHKIIIPVSSVHRGTLEAVRYAQVLGGEVTGAYVELDPANTERFRTEWEKWFPGVGLDILPSPYRSVVGPLLLYMDQVQHHAGKDVALTIIIPQFIPKRLWHHLLHNQTALVLKLALLYRRGMLRRYKVLTDVPFYLRR